MRDQCLRVYVTEDDAGQIRQAANAVGLSVSEYLRRCGCKRKISSRIDQQSIDDLMSVNADLARLGNLMKFAMTEFSDEMNDQVTQKLVQDAHETIEQIRGQQAMLKQKIIALKG